MGFTGPVRSGMIEQFGVAVDSRGNVAANANYMTSVDRIFAAGDMRRGHLSWSGPSQKAAKPLPPLTLTWPQKQSALAAPHALA